QVHILIPLFWIYPDARRAFLHLSYSYAAPCGPALLVTQGPFRKSPVHRSNRDNGEIGSGAKSSLGVERNHFGDRYSITSSPGEAQDPKPVQHHAREH